MKPLRPINSSKAAKPPRPEPQTAAQLRDLQRTMAGAVMRPLSDEGGMRGTWMDGRSAEKAVACFIKPNDRLTSFERLEIYNRQYWFRLMDCLGEDYPGVRAVIGDSQFHNLAIAYLAQNPSTSFTLRNLGRQLPAFIRAQPRWTAPHQALALDMARLEWAHIEAFDSEAKTPITAGELAGRDPAEIRLPLQPYLTLLHLDWPLDNYLIKLRENSRLRGEASNAIEQSQRRPRARRVPIPKPDPTYLAVHRHRNLVYYKRLDRVQFQVLTALQKGKSLNNALRTLPADAGDLPIREWFENWSTLAWFCKLPAK
jgi:hypothetical protein